MKKSSIFLIVACSTLPLSDLSFAGRIDTNQVTPSQAIDETCLDARTIKNASHVELDQNGWHADSRLEEYGQHITLRVFDADGTRIDTLHIYQQQGPDDDCLITFSQKNYDGLGTPVGDDFFMYNYDTAKHL